jgi:hypothetical protein
MLRRRASCKIYRAVEILDCNGGDYEDGCFVVC